MLEVVEGDRVGWLPISSVPSARRRDRVRGPMASLLAPLEVLEWAGCRCFQYKCPTARGCGRALRALLSRESCAGVGRTPADRLQLFGGDPDIY